jgi:transcriptional regulator with XRE-family HTH domain
MWWSMITGIQIRAARSALRWTAEDLASRAEIASRTVKRMETYDSVPKSSSQTLEKIRKAFEAAGIEFTGTPEDLPGVRMNLAKKNAATL